jgi:hypothetical protein
MTVEEKTRQDVGALKSGYDNGTRICSTDRRHDEVLTEHANDWADGFAHHFEDDVNVELRAHHKRVDRDEHGHDHNEYCVHQHRPPTAQHGYLCSTEHLN